MDHKTYHRKDELLELLWHLDEHHDLTLSALREHDSEGDFEEDLNSFSNNGILVLDGETIMLTETGRELARNIVRRHRLAERLLVDVLGKTVEETEEAACEFEHILAPELVESICVLLGHPHVCPHNSPIPEGDCCREARDQVESLVIPVPRLAPGQSAKIASLNTRNKSRMNKLLAMGVTPGTNITLLQKTPALVIEVNQTHIALEELIGEDINVWRPLD